MKEFNIDCMKHRKSTHLASVDIEAIIAEKGTCFLKIKEAFYETGVNVSGNKTDGYFLIFEEDVKPMVANSTNRKRISNIVKTLKNMNDVDSRNIGNWVGLTIQLAVDKTVKMMGEIVDGIRVVETVQLPILTETHKKFKAVKEALANGTYTIEQMKTKYIINDEIEKLLKND